MKLIAAASGFILAAGGALAAAPAPKEVGPSCDFFQAELIGVICARTAYVGLGFEGTDETRNRTTPALGVVRMETLNLGAPTFVRDPRISATIAPPPRTITIPFYGLGAQSQRWNYRESYESATLAVAPWEGLQINVHGEAFQYDNTYSSRFIPDGGGASYTAATNQHQTGSNGGWQGIGAVATILDRQSGNLRYVISAVGDVEFLPGGGAYGARDQQNIGWRSGAEMRLGGSGYSLDYLAENILLHVDNHSFYEAESTTRVLLANRDYGWAVGPRLATSVVLWHGSGVNTGWAETMLGGEALLQPFRRTSFPVLRDVTFDVVAVHSVGQAALVPDWAGNASNFIYSATARVNFPF